MYPQQLLTSHILYSTNHLNAYLSYDVLVILDDYSQSFLHTLTVQESTQHTEMLHYRVLVIQQHILDNTNIHFLTCCLCVIQLILSFLLTLLTSLIITCNLITYIFHEYLIQDKSNFFFHPLVLLMKSFSTVS
jgi:hypothetical protein